MSIQNQAFFKVNKESEDTKLQWLEANLHLLTNESRGRTVIQMENLRAYANANSVYSINEPADQYFQRISNDIEKVRIPHIHDITEVKVSQMTRLKSHVRVLPKHSEYDDRGTAKIAGLVVGNIFAEQDVDRKSIELHRYKYIFGEVYEFVEWDQTIGDFDETYLKAKQMGKTSILIPSGKKIPIDFPMRKGDLKIRLEMPWNVLFERKRSGKYEDANYMYNISYTVRDELLEDNPKLSDLDVGNDSETQNGANAYLKSHYAGITDEVAVFHFYHKKTKYLPKGKYIKFIAGRILEETDLPYSHGDFPCERLTDLDMPTQPNGVSRYSICLPIQKRIDDISLLIDKNLKAFALTKYVTYAGTQIDELNDDSINITVPPGGQAPSILKVDAVPQHLVERTLKLEADLERLMGSHGISRGMLPKGVDTKPSMAYLTEMESERATSEITKAAKFTTDLARKSLSTMADNIKDDEKRMVKMVGKDNATYIKDFKAADLNKPYDIVFTNSDGFPETEAAKRERISMYMHQNPDMMTGAEWMHYLDMADDEGITDAVTEAIRSSESENEDLLAGKPVGAPESFEEGVTHLRVHYRGMQKRFFKEEAPLAIKATFKKHVFDTEEILIEQMQSSPLLQAQLATLPQFPMFKHEGYTPPMSSEQAAAVAQGQANRGEPVSAMIPGVPKKEIL